ncbi:MAG: hypothetical protein ABWY13_07230 [Mesorhizobium sp.]
MKPVAAILIMATLVAFMAKALAEEQKLIEEETKPAQPTDAGGMAMWEKIYAVFSHPRCANCHVEDARPRWSGPEFTITRVHGFNVQRGRDNHGTPGLRCNNCHSERNSQVLHAPPGAPKWRLAPAEMAWFGKSSAEICAQIKDPGRTNGRGLDAIADHIRKDQLVAWGWKPGAGREAAPGSAEETFHAIERWKAAGAPCP